MATLGTTGSGWGSVWIAPTQPAISQREFAALVWNATGNPGSPRTTVVGRRMLTALGLVVPVVREVVEMYYENGKPFVVDSSCFESTFGIEPTPMTQAIQITLESCQGSQIVHA